MSFSKIGITMLANTGYVCLARPLLRFQRPFHYFTSCTCKRNLKTLRTNITNKPLALPRRLPHNRTNSHSCRGYPLITQTEESDELEAEQFQQDKAFLHPPQYRQEMDLVEMLAYAEKMMMMSMQLVEMQKKQKKCQPQYTHWDETPVDFTVLISSENFDRINRNRHPLDIRALKRGPPTDGNKKEEILVVHPCVNDWKPPSNMDIVNTKYFEDMSKLLNMGTSVPNVDPPLLIDMNIQEQIYDLQLVILLQTAIEDGWIKQTGRDGLRSLFELVQRVILEHNHRSNIKPDDYRQWMYSNNLGGDTTSAKHCVSFAFSGLEDDYIITDEDMEVEETTGDREQLDAKLSAILTEDRWIDTEGNFKCKTHTPDAGLFIKQTSIPEGNRSTIGLLAGEVKSIHEPVRKPTLFRDATIRLRPAWNQALLGLKYRNETATLVMSSNKAVFMEIKIKNGHIVTDVKFYPVMKSDKREPDQEVFQELFTDLVKYVWNTYFNNIKYGNVKWCREEGGN